MSEKELENVIPEAEETVEEVLEETAQEVVEDVVEEIGLNGGGIVGEGGDIQRGVFPREGADTLFGEAIEGVVLVLGDGPGDE